MFENPELKDIGQYCLLMTSQGGIRMEVTPF